MASTPTTAADGLSAPHVPSNRLADALHQRPAGRKWLIPYLTPEFPTAGATVPLLLALQSAGADAIELGLPFSDPLADGPTIQAASNRALANGASVRRVIERVREARAAGLTVPLLLMGYINPILRYGAQAFAHDAAEAGADGLILPDLPPEEGEVIAAPARTNGLSVVYLIAPTSSDERIRQIDRASSDFSYCVSVTGVTGVKEAGADALSSFLGRVARLAEKPFVVGFGLSRPEQIRAVWDGPAFGAVVGSALLRAIETAPDTETAVQSATQFLRPLREA